jgi:hypothetical protein
VRVLADLLQVLLAHHAHDSSADVVEIEPGRRLDGLLSMALQAIADPAQILLIPRQSREVVGEQDIPFPYPLDEGQDPRSVVSRGSGDPVLRDD